MRVLRNITLPLVIIALAVTPIIAVSCGGSSSSSNDKNFCVKLDGLETVLAMSPLADDLGELKGFIPLIADLAKTAPNAELKKAMETMKSLVEKMSAIDVKDPDALDVLTSLTSDSEVVSASETVDAYLTDVCKVSQTTDLTPSDDSSMTLPSSTDDQNPYQAGTIWGDMETDDITNAVEPLKSTSFPNGYINSWGFEAGDNDSTLVSIDFADTDSVDALAVCEAIDAAIAKKTTDTNVSIKVTVNEKEVGGRPVGGTCSAK